eukprot:Cvel_32440.t1-p1 / transcript=Cvel_32440.t1 / gene=Cvel_32440 / organism=Chromera_velia_CCMP2878 / gene_product=Serine/threonine-protein kinase BRSK2, putative / transcript_product=Serine/threonine-protein kinase BRSK2, putative / location=Cvel_scaffold5048:1-2696(-) / protein_length=405 / sequence_SO=supercontig / SO=protein_coding / is_pseudo=false
MGADPVEDFETEICIMQQVCTGECPHIVQFIEYFEDDHFYYVVMEHCGGGELFSYLVNKNFLTEEEIAHFMWQILTALDFIHKRSIVHRDVKPQNFLFKHPQSGDARQQTVKMIDFGLSCFMPSPEEVEVKLVQSTTGEGDDESPVKSFSNTMALQIDAPPSPTRRLSAGHSKHAFSMMEEQKKNHHQQQQQKKNDATPVTPPSPENRHASTTTVTSSVQVEQRESIKEGGPFTPRQEKFVVCPTGNGPASPRQKRDHLGDGEGNAKCHWQAEEDNSRKVWLVDPCGTPEFVAPEMVLGKYDTQVDVWAAGIMLYMFLFGSQPFKAESESKLWKKIVRQQPSFKPHNTTGTRKRDSTDLGQVQGGPVGSSAGGGVSPRSRHGSAGGGISPRSRPGSAGGGGGGGG